MNVELSGSFPARLLIRLPFVSALPMVLATSLLAQPSGEAVYSQRCAVCHNTPDGRTPAREALQKLTVSRILKTLDFGVMMTVAYTLKRDEREAVAAYLGREGNDAPPQPQAFCADRSVELKSPNGAGMAGVPTLPTHATNARACRWIKLHA